MTGKDDAFLSRWSRLKRRGGDADPVPAAAPAAADPPAADPSSPDPAAALTLEDVAALKPDADFRPFLAAAATEAVHRAALRKLWASDPIITAHDGLTDYAEDYTFKTDVVEQVRTAWRGGVDAWEQASGGDQKEIAQDVGGIPVDDRYAQQSITDKKVDEDVCFTPDKVADPFANA
jgi:hypothetical protein